MQRMSQFVIITEALVISFFKDNMMLWFHIFEEYIFGHVPPVYSLRFNFTTSHNRLIGVNCCYVGLRQIVQRSSSSVKSLKILFC